jgi:hypothetical protein
VGRFVDLNGFAVRGLAGRSSLPSESTPNPASSLSLSSPSKSGIAFVAVFAFVLSESAVETRGTFEGRNGLKGGALRFEAG